MLTVRTEQLEKIKFQKKLKKFLTKVKRYDIIQKLLNENLQKEVFGQVKKFLKKLKKILDKQQNVWYNE